MRQKRSAIVLFAIIPGLIVLAGYFLPQVGLLQTIRRMILDWAITLFGIAMLLGIYNFIALHWRKVAATGEGHDFYSLVTIITFALTVLLGLYYSPSDPRFQSIVLNLLKPLETSLLAVLLIALVSAGFTFMHRHINPLSVTFGASVVVYLLLYTGIIVHYLQHPLIGKIITYLHWLPTAGARGLIIAVAVATIVTGLRTILGQDQPYLGK